MPVLKILLNDKGDVVGTANVDQSPTHGAYRGPHGARGPQQGPQQATMVARANQRIVEVKVEDAMAKLDPESLHKELKNLVPK